MGPTEKMWTMADCTFSRHTTKCGILLSDHCLDGLVMNLELGSRFCWRWQKKLTHRLAP